MARRRDIPLFYLLSTQERAYTHNWDNWDAMLEGVNTGELDYNIESNDARWLNLIGT